MCVLISQCVCVYNGPPYNCTMYGVSRTCSTEYSVVLREIEEFIGEQSKIENAEFQTGQTLLSIIIYLFFEHACSSEGNKF